MANLSHNMQVQETNVSEVLHNAIKTKITEVKLKQLALWNQGSVYIVVPNEGQCAISTCWVVSPKAFDGQMSIKACLVLKEFKKDQNKKSDSPTCLQESVRLFMTWKPPWFK